MIEIPQERKSILGSGNESDPYTFDFNVSNQTLTEVIFSGASQSWERALNGEKIFFKLDAGIISVKRSAYTTPESPLFTLDILNKNGSSNLDNDRLIEFGSMACSVFTLAATRNQK